MFKEEAKGRERLSSRIRLGALRGQQEVTTGRVSKQGQATKDLGRNF